MKKISLTDGSGAWFTAEKAKLYKEKSVWNGNNWISCATGSQWEHECIFITAGGKFILNAYSQIQGSKETYEEVSKDFAAQWFAKQGFDNDDIPGELHELVSAMEI